MILNKLNGSIKSKPTHPTPLDICQAFDNCWVGGGCVGLELTEP